jgi:hypothetical protein
VNTHSDVGKGLPKLVPFEHMIANPLVISSQPLDCKCPVFLGEKFGRSDIFGKEHVHGDCKDHRDTSGDQGEDAPAMKDESCCCRTTRAAVCDYSSHHAREASTSRPDPNSASVFVFCVYIDGVREPMVPYMIEANSNLHHFAVMRTKPQLTVDSSIPMKTSFISSYS